MSTDVMAPGTVAVGAALTSADPPINVTTPSATPAPRAR
jgi:hypothetical protein